VPIDFFPPYKIRGEILNQETQPVSVQGGIVKQPVALILWEDSPGAAEREKHCLS